MMNIVWESVSISVQREVIEGSLKVSSSNFILGSVEVEEERSKWNEESSAE